MVVERYKNAWGSKDGYRFSDSVATRAGEEGGPKVGPAFVKEIDLRIIARTIGSKVSFPNADTVLCAVALPKGGRVLSVHGELHVVGEEAQPVDEWMAYGFMSELIPVIDPTTQITYQQLWDNVVVKAADPTNSANTQMLDYDWETADTAPAIEPGEMDIDDLLGLTQGQKEIIAPRLEWMSWAKSRQGGYAAATPDTFLPSDFKTFRSRRTVVADVPSAAILTFSNPLLDDVIVENDFVPPIDEGEWYMMANMEDTLRQFAKINAGVTESGSESPYSEASTLLANLVAPRMLDESTTTYNSVTYDVLCVATWVLDFPSDSIPNTIDGR